jgi:hypothetical protein
VELDFNFVAGEDSTLTEEQLESLQLPTRSFKNRPSSEISRLMTAQNIRDATLTYTPSHVRLAERSNNAEKVKLEKMRILLDTKLDMFELEKDEFDQKRRKAEKEQERLNKVCL